MADGSAVDGLEAIYMESHNSHIVGSEDGDLERIVDRAERKRIWEG